MSSGGLPLNILFVRHGESEGNIAARYEDAGVPDLQEKISRKTGYDYRLTKTGIGQAEAAGRWIKKNISQKFDRYFTSDLLRARETASLLGIENAEWTLDTDLREQHLPPRSITWMDTSLFRSWGINSFIDTLLRTCGGLSVVVVCHATIIRSFMIRLEQLRYKNFHDVERNPDLTVKNCEIVWYSRRDPSTQAVVPTLSWKTMIVPYEVFLSAPSALVWKKIVIPTFSNTDLMKSVEKSSPLLITETEDELKRKYRLDVSSIDSEIASLALSITDLRMLSSYQETDIASFL